jgi:hypothetical protein
MIIWTISGILTGVLYGVMVAAMTKDIMSQMELEPGPVIIEEAIETPTPDLPELPELESVEP